MAAYKVKEIFYTLQGEGAQSGRPAVFCRFSGCNLWSGREQDRHKAICKFCDTDFWGTDGINGGRFATAEDLAQRVADFWPIRKSPSSTGTNSNWFSPRWAPNQNATRIWILNTSTSSRWTVTARRKTPRLPSNTACATPSGN